MPLPRRHYRDPPLLEAVAEFRFLAGRWDQTVPGLLYERVRNQFPDKEQMAVVETTLAPNPEGGVQQAVTQVERLQLRRSDGTALLSLSPHYLSVSRVAPYDSWEEFEPLIADALAAYRDVADPKGIQRIGLRFVNQVTLEGRPEIDLGDFFEFHPELGPHLPHSHQSFICGVQIPFEDSRDLVKVQLADQPAPADKAVFLLDIDYFLNRAGEVPFDNVETWLGTAHERIEQIFEGCITDALRERFRERDN